MLGGGRNPAVLAAEMERMMKVPRRAVEGDGQEDHVVGGG